MDKPCRLRIYEFEEFRLDVARLMLYHGQEELSLPPKAVETLLALVERRGEIVHKDELMEAIWTDSIVEESNLAKYLHVLRKTLGNRADGRPFLETFRRRGYRFNGEVITSEISPAAPVQAETANQNFALPANGREIAENKNGGASKEATTGKIVALADWRNATAKTETGEMPPLAVLPNASPEKSPTVRRRKISLVGAAALGVLIVALGFFAFTRFRSAQTSDANAPPKSIAVLPFRNESGDAEMDYLAEGVAESVINNLSQFSALKVISRNSSFRFKDDQNDTRRIAVRLGAENIVTGDVKQVGDRLVINVRLINAADDAQIWGGQYVKNSGDIIAAQNEIAQAIADNLSLKLTVAERQRLTRRYTENVEAYRLYLKGRHHTFKLTPPEIGKGIAYFRQTIELDPSYALAYAGLSDAFRALALSGEVPATEAMPKAKAAAQKAVEIDDRSAEARASLSSIIFWYEWDWKTAENEIVRALELDPNNADARIFYAYLLSNTGRHAEALGEARRAGELDPLSSVANALEGQFLLHAGQPDAALDKLRQTFELNPNFGLAHLFAASAYIEKGMHREAAAAARRAKELGGGNNSSAFFCYALAKSGGATEARDELEKLLQFSKERYVLPYNIALIYQSLNNRDEALAWLERGFKNATRG